MPKAATGGTASWCPQCRAFNQCAVVPASKKLGYKRNTRGSLRYFADQPDIRWRRRVRRCLKCSHIFESVELPFTQIIELRKLRDQLKIIAERLDEYKIDAEKAAESLKQITSSLDKLKQIKIDFD